MTFSTVLGADRARVRRMGEASVRLRLKPLHLPANYLPRPDECFGGRFSVLYGNADQSSCVRRQRALKRFVVLWRHRMATRIPLVCNISQHSVNGSVDGCVTTKATVKKVT